MISLLVRPISILVLGFAVSIGIIGKVRPQLFLKIPKFGFIPWALTGNPMPPYFDDSCLLKENWQGQDGDIMISSGAKAGTLWLHNIVLLLRSNGWDDFDRLADYYDSCEMMDHPYDTLEARLKANEEKRAVAQAKGLHGFQIFTHHSPGEDPRLVGIDPALNPNVKYIAIGRNGKEVVKSFLPFLNSHTDKFKAMWGGFPPEMGPEDAIKMICDDLPSFYFGHLLAWWERRNLPNVLLLHYRNLRQDPASVITQIAEFLGISLTPELLEIILHKSSLEYMSHASRARIYSGYVGYPDDRFFYVEEDKHIVPGGGQLHNDDDGFFSEAMSKKWEASVQKHFGHDAALIEFANHGTLSLAS